MANQRHDVSAKYLFRFTEMCGSLSAILARIEGRFAIVTNVGLEMRWTRQRGRTTLQRTAKPCGPGAPTLALSPQRCVRILRVTVAKEPGHRGERGVSR